MEKLSKTWRTKEAFITKIKMRIQYFNDHSSLSRVGHVISMSRTSAFKRLFWLVTFSACCYGSAVLLRGALGLYIGVAVSYSMETDYLQWDTTFPAVTLCEQLNEKKVESAIKNKYPTTLNGFAKEISFWNFRYCRSCLHCKMNVTCIENYLPILELTRSPCEEIMTTCWFDGKEFPCCERKECPCCQAWQVASIGKSPQYWRRHMFRSGCPLADMMKFKPVATEYGVCFVFNSQLTGDGHVKVNRRIGLPTLIFNVLRKVSIIVHSPEERISVATEKLLGPCYQLGGSKFEVNLMAEEIVNDVSVRALPPESRDCLFQDERPAGLKDWPFHDYSYSGCVWYCRTLAQIKMCNCSSHFMPRIKNVPMCNTEGLKCLHNNYKKPLEIENCHCPMSCEEVTFKPIYVACPKNGESRATQGSVKIGQLPHQRVRRQAIRDMLGLVVDIGGVIGVFFGASLLSFIEIVHIFCIRKYP